MITGAVTRRRLRGRSPFGAPSGAHSHPPRGPPSHCQRFPLPRRGEATLLHLRFTGQTLSQTVPVCQAPKCILSVLPYPRIPGITNDGAVAEPVLQYPFLYQRKGIQKQLRNKDCQEINNFRVVWRGGSPSILNPQQRQARCEENFCGAKQEQKFIHCAFAARESRRDERQRRGG